MEPLVLSILGLAGWLKMILTAVVIVGLLLLANIIIMVLTRRAPRARPAGVEPGPQKDEPPARAAADPKPGRKRRILAGFSILMALVLATAALADLFFFDALARQALGRWTAKAGIRVDFSSAQGSFRTGQFHFTDLTAQRPEHPLSVFDLRAASAEVDISMRDMLRGRIVFENLEIRGLDGAWEQRGRVNKEAGWLARLPGGRPGKARPRPFRIDKFKLLDGRLAYQNLARSRPLAAELRLEHLQAAPLHSDRLLYNLLFTGGARGSFSGLDFIIDPPADGRQSTWRCDGLPLPVLASLVGGPLEWFERGRADIVVENRENPGTPGGTVTNWNLVLRDFQVEAPAGTSRLARMAAAPVTAYLNDRNERLDLNLDFELRPEELRLAGSSDLAELIKTALVRTLTQKFETLKSNLVEGTLNRVKRSFFNRKGADSEETPPQGETAETSDPK